MFKNLRNYFKRLFNRPSIDPHLTAKAIWYMHIYQDRPPETGMLLPVEFINIRIEVN